MFVDDAVRGQATVITRHGKPEVVVLSFTEWERFIERFDRSGASHFEVSSGSIVAAPAIVTTAIVCIAA